MLQTKSSKMKDKGNRCRFREPAFELTKWYRKALKAAGMAVIRGCILWKSVRCRGAAGRIYLQPDTLGFLFLRKEDSRKEEVCILVSGIFLRFFA